MDTQTLVTRLKDDFLPSVSRTIILDWLDIVQNIMFGHDCQNTLLYDTAQTWPLPFVKTTAGTLSYELTSANLTVAPTINGYATSVRSVKDLYLKSSDAYNSEYSKRYMREVIQKVAKNPDYYGAQTQFRKYPFQFVAKRGIQNAKIIFAEDPGTYTDRYIIECYLNAVPLASENIPLSVNGDEWFDALRKGVVGYSEVVAYGKSDQWNEFKEIECKRYWGNSNKGDELRPNQIQPHY